MLNGIDPVIIFQFFKLTDVDVTTLSQKTKIPIVSKTKQRTTFAVIPIYLSENITGMYIDTEEKNLDIETVATGLTDGSAALINQKPVNSTVSINLIASTGSLGATLLGAMADQIFDKVVSNEHEISYVHGAASVFGGLLHGFSISQESDNDIYRIKLEIARGNKNKAIEVQKQADATRLGGEGATPPTNLPKLGSTPSSAPQSISPIQSSPVSLGRLK